MNTAADVAETTLTFEARGAVLALGQHHERLVALCGPAGTGKSRGALEYLHYLLSKYPHTRGLMLRKTRKSLSESGMVTFWEKVQPELDGVKWKSSLARYVYPNGSICAVGGLDNASKVLSSEWDLIYIQQAEETEEEDVEACLMRVNRPGQRSAIPFNQVILDVNPGPPTHWLRARMDRGAATELISQHEDNPALYDAATQDWTEAGRVYMATLDALTGVRYLRYRKGLWAAAEGMVYQDVWQPRWHLIPNYELPSHWARYWVIDWGFTHPFVWQCWATDPDGRLYREHEIYMTHRTVTAHCETIKQITRGKPSAFPQLVIADPSEPGDAAIFAQCMNREVTPAQNAVAAGINAVTDRLKLAADRRPRLYYLRDARYELDRTLAEKHQPTCTEEEYESYVWQTPHATSLGVGNRGEEPVKENDHGLDATRYMVAQFDLQDSRVSYAEVPW